MPNRNPAYTLRDHLVDEFSKSGVAPTPEQIEALLQLSEAILRGRSDVSVVSPELLAATALEEASRKQIPLDLSRSPRQHKQQLTSALPRYRLLLCFAGCENLTGVAIEADARNFFRLRQLGAGFISAIHPRTLEVMERQSDGWERMIAWWTNTQTPLRADFVAIAKRVFDEVLIGNERLTSDKLLALIPRARLASYHSAMLVEVATNYGLYWPLISYLRNRRGGHKDPDIELKLDKLSKGLIAAIAMELGQRFAADAAQHAITWMIESIDAVPEFYFFEHDVFRTLLRRAFAYLRSEQRFDARGLPDCFDEEDDAPPVEVRCDRRQAAAIHIARFMFVRLLSREYQQRAMQIWMMRSLFQDAVSDPMLAPLFSFELGKSVTPLAIATMRQRLGRRVLALEHASVMPVDNPAFGDLRAATAVACQPGRVEGQEIRPMETVIAYGFAARVDEDPLLLVAGLIHSAVDVPSFAAGHGLKLVGPLQELWLAGGGARSALRTKDQLDEIMRRLDWFLADVASPIKKIRAVAAGAKIGHLTGVCFYLAAVLRKSVDDAVQIVRPGGAEELAAWRSMLEMLA